jgi:hypothetical protein
MLGMLTLCPRVSHVPARLPHSAVLAVVDLLELPLADAVAEEDEVLRLAAPRHAVELQQQVLHLQTADRTCQDSRGIRG